MEYVQAGSTGTSKLTCFRAWTSVSEDFYFVVYKAAHYYSAVVQRVWAAYSQSVLPKGCWIVETDLSSASAPNEG